MLPSRSMQAATVGLGVEDVREIRIEIDPERARSDDRLELIDAVERAARERDIAFRSTGPMPERATPSQ